MNQWLIFFILSFGIFATASVLHALVNAFERVRIAKHTGRVPERGRNE